MRYSTLYNIGLSKLPDKLIEKSGGPFYRVLSSIFKKEYPQKLYLPQLEKSIAFPWGLSSGWADSYEKILAIKNLGAGIVFGKTITYLARKGNPYPRLVREPNKRWLINSMGLPNSGLIRWIKWTKKKGKLPSGCFLSVKGDNIYEWKTLLGNLQNCSDLVEINLSCPNVKKGILDITKTKALIQSISSKAIKTKLTIKLSPEYSSAQILNLIKSIDIEKSNIIGVSIFNTFPVRHNRLGNEQGKGGLSGPPLYNKLLTTIRKIREEYSFKDLLIFATGGISTFEQVNHVWNTYRAFPLMLTGFLTEGPFIFYKILSDFKNSQN